MKNKIDRSPYTFEELADLYSRFRGNPDEIEILSGFAGIPEAQWGEAYDLRDRLASYLDRKKLKMHD